MPAMPIADSSAPIVVGIRQTSSAIRTVRLMTEQEHDRHEREQNRERNLVRSPAALGAFDHRDHAVEEAFAFLARDADDDSIRQHSRTTGHRREIAASLT
jgi:hypothetical protein